MNVILTWQYGNSESYAKLFFKIKFELKITRPVLNRFQDSSKTGLGINFFSTFLAAFFAAFFADFFEPAFLSLQYKRRAIFLRYSVQKSVAVFRGGWGGCVCVYRSLS